MITQVKKNTQKDDRNDALISKNVQTIGSMYGVFTYIRWIFMVNEGRYTSPMDCLRGTKHAVKHGFSGHFQCGGGTQFLGGTV